MSPYDPCRRWGARRFWLPNRLPFLLPPSASSMRFLTLCSCCREALLDIRRELLLETRVIGFVTRALAASLAAFWFF